METLIAALFVGACSLWVGYNIADNKIRKKVSEIYKVIRQIRDQYAPVVKVTVSYYNEETKKFETKEVDQKQFSKTIENRLDDLR